MAKEKRTKKGQNEPIGPCFQYRHWCMGILILITNHKHYNTSMFIIQYYVFTLNVDIGQTIQIQSSLFYDIEKDFSLITCKLYFNLFKFDP